MPATGLDVLAEIRSTAQDEVVGLEDAAGLRRIVVHPGSVSCVDNKPPHRHGRNARTQPARVVLLQSLEPPTLLAQR